MYATVDPNKPNSSLPYGMHKGKRLSAIPTEYPEMAVAGHEAQHRTPLCRGSGATRQARSCPSAAQLLATSPCPSWRCGVQSTASRGNRDVRVRG